MICPYCEMKLCCCVQCHVCKGHGADPMSDNLHWLPCSYCKGRGRFVPRDRANVINERNRCAASLIGGEDE